MLSFGNLQKQLEEAKRKADKVAEMMLRPTQAIITTEFHQTLKAYLQESHDKLAAGSLKTLFGQLTDLLDAYATQTTTSLTFNWLINIRSDLEQRITNIIASAYKVELEARGIEYTSKDQANISELAARITSFGPKLLSSFDHYVKEQRNAMEDTNFQTFTAATKPKKSKIGFLKNYVQDKFKDKAKNAIKTLQNASAAKNSEELLVADIIARLQHDGLLPEDINEKDLIILGDLLALRVLSMFTKFEFTSFIEQAIPGNYYAIVRTKEGKEFIDKDLLEKEKKENRESKQLAKRNIGQFAKNIYRLKPFFTQIAVINYASKKIESLLASGMNQIIANKNASILFSVAALCHNTNQTYINFFDDKLASESLNSMRNLFEFGASGPEIGINQVLEIVQTIIQPQPIFSRNNERSKISETIIKSLSERLAQAISFQIFDYSCRLPYDKNLLKKLIESCKDPMLNIAMQKVVNFTLHKMLSGSVLDFNYYTPQPNSSNKLAFLTSLTTLITDNQERYSAIYYALKKNEPQSAEMRIFEHLIKKQIFAPLNNDQIKHAYEIAPKNHSSSVIGLTYHRH